MKLEVSQAIEELKRKFPDSVLTFEDDGSGGARVLLENMDVGPKLSPSRTWLAAHIPGQYPYADIYPVFMGREVSRADGKPFEVPITAVNYGDKPAWQVSRRSQQAQLKQPAHAKFIKVIDFLRNL